MSQQVKPAKERRQGTIFEKHSIVWKGGALPEESTDGVEQLLKTGCGGFCRQSEVRRLALAVAMDAVPSKNETVSF